MSRISGRQVVGVDQHLRRSVVGIIDADGRECGWVRIDNDPKALVRECRKAGRARPAAAGRRGPRGRTGP
jgi:hypothetical protein